MPMLAEPRPNSDLPRSARRSSYSQSVFSELMQGTNAVPGSACADRIRADETLSQTGVLSPRGPVQPESIRAAPRTTAVGLRSVI